jgi:hypothetical protein
MFNKNDHQDAIDDIESGIRDLRCSVDCLDECDTHEEVCGNLVAIIADAELLLANARKLLSNVK